MHCARTDFTTERKALKWSARGKMLRAAIGASCAVATVPAQRVQGVLDMLWWPVLPKTAATCAAAGVPQLSVAIADRMMPKLAAAGRKFGHRYGRCGWMIVAEGLPLSLIICNNVFAD